MNHKDRELLATWVFDSFTHTILQILPPVPKAKGKNCPPPKDPIDSVRKSLLAFRKHFDGRALGSLDEAAYVQRWTPDEVAKVFANLAPVVTELINIVPALAQVASPVASLPSGPIPDACRSFDALLVALGTYIEQVRFHYWAQHRKSLAENVNPDAAKNEATGYLINELQSFCSHARVVSKGNDVIFGALVEEFLRQKVTVAVHPMAVSSGGIYGLAHMSQLDCIIWDRAAGLPAIEVGNVAVVSPISARAVIEFKSSCDSTLADFVHRIMTLHAEGSVLQDAYSKTLYTQALGIVVWTDIQPARFRAIAGTLVLPLFYRADVVLTPNHPAFEALFEFLHRWGRPA